MNIFWFVWYVMVSPVQVHVRPAVCFAPCAIVTTIRVEDAKEGEWVDLVVESAEGESFASKINMSNRRYTYEQTARVVRTPGEYEVRATLHRRGEPRYEAVGMFSVKSGDGGTK